VVSCPKKNDVGDIVPAVVVRVTVTSEPVVFSPKIVPLKEFCEDGVLKNTPRFKAATVLTKPEKDADIDPYAFDAVIVNEYGPCVVGVPVIAPVEEFRLVPDGKDPEVTLYDPLYCIFVAVTPSLKATPSIKLLTVLSTQEGGKVGAI
jgi:hypothetical protein